MLPKVSLSGRTMRPVGVQYHPIGTVWLTLVRLR